MYIKKEEEEEMKNKWIKAKWLNHADILRTYEFAKKHSGGEELELNKSEIWQGKEVSIYEKFYVSLVRTSGVIHRKTLASSNYWIVLSPSTCEKGIFCPYVFEGRSNKSWDGKVNWRDKSEEISPKVYKAPLLNLAYRIYIVEEFPDDVVLMGSNQEEGNNYKKVTRLRKNEDGSLVREENGDVVRYKGSPTHRNFGVIQLKH